MGWEIGYDDDWKRDIGYGVPATCDAPKCEVKIDRGLSYVCGGEPYGGEHGCGLYFCSAHLTARTPHESTRMLFLCPRCLFYKPPYKRPSPDRPEWIRHKLADESWATWRAEHPEEVAEITKALEKHDADQAV